VNRVRPERKGRPTPGAVRDELQRLGIALGSDAEERILRAFDDEAKLGQMDRRHLSALSALDVGGAGPLRVEVPAFAGDVHDLRRLAQVAAVLAPSS
jgi:hypothetical protein